VMRHVFVFTIRWFQWRSGGFGPQGKAICVLLAYAALFCQLYTVDLATHYLREDKHESLTETWPFWKGCPAWTENFIKFYYTVAQFQATTLMLDMAPWLFMNVMVIFPFQWASLLMTLVRKGVITTAGYHVGYLWSLIQVVFCAMVAHEDLLIQAWVIWITLYLVRRQGLNKYALWIGMMILSFGQNVFPEWYEANKGTAMLAPPAFWAAWAFVQWMLQGQVSETRARRYLESRPKTLEVIHKEKVSDSLVWIRFGLPAGFTTGLSPGQHIRVHCPNPSKGRTTWNDRGNLEDSPTTLSRSYTPASAPDALALDIIVKEYLPNARLGFPDGGRASTFLAGKVEVGTGVPVSGPHGHKVYHGDGLFLIGAKTKRARHVAALVGGSGITPALATLRELRAEASGLPKGAKPFVANVSVLHVVHSEGEALGASWYQPEAEIGSQVSCCFQTFATSELQAESGAAQRPRLRPEQLRDALSELFPPSAADVVVLVCGPKAFVEEVCQPVLRDLGYENVIQMW